MNRITDEEGDVETRQWSPVPLGGFETNASHGASNGSQPGESMNTMGSSAFWGFDEPDQKPVLRTERIIQAEQSSQQQPNHHSPEALIGRLQKRASEGDDDALATLKMMDSMHGQHMRVPARMGESPPVNRSVWTNADDRSPEKMFETSSATHLALAQLASQGDTTALSALRMLEAIRLTEMHSNPMGGKLSYSDSGEKVPAPRRIDTVKVIVKAIDLSTPEASENSLYTFGSTCRAVGIPRSGLTTPEDEALALLVDKWTTSNPTITSSLRRTFGDGGTGSARLEHVKSIFMLPLIAKRDIDPEAEIQKFNFAEIFRSCLLYTSPSPRD